MVYSKLGVAAYNSDAQFRVGLLSLNNHLSNVKRTSRQRRLPHMPPCTTSTNERFFWRERSFLQPLLAIELKIRGRYHQKSLLRRLAITESIAVAGGRLLFSWGLKIYASGGGQAVGKRPGGRDHKRHLPAAASSATATATIRMLEIEWRDGGDDDNNIIVGQVVFCGICE